MERPNKRRSMRRSLSNFSRACFFPSSNPDPDSFAEPARPAPVRQTSNRPAQVRLASAASIEKDARDSSSIEMTETENQAKKQKRASYVPRHAAASFMSSTTPLTPKEIKRRSMIASTTPVVPTFAAVAEDRSVRAARRKTMM